MESILLIPILMADGFIFEKRRLMETRDEEMKKHAEKEKETEENQPLEVGVMYHKHLQHPLNEVDAADKFVCGGCQRPGQRGRRFQCSVDGCGFEMHKVCAAPPVMIVGDDSGTPEEEALPELIKTVAHREHHDYVKKVYRKVEIFECGHCTNVGRGFRYRCEVEGCKCTLHPICAKSPTGIKSFMHPRHRLSLITRPYFAKCAVCNRGKKSHINNRVYACQTCKFYVHPTCSLWPQYLFHELHPKPHLLQLKPNPSSSSSSTCSACKEKSNGYMMYCCETCGESFHPLCLLRSSNKAKTDGARNNAFRKEVAEQSEFHVEFVGVDRLGIIG